MAPGAPRTLWASGQLWTSQAWLREPWKEAKENRQLVAISAWRKPTSKHQCLPVDTSPPPVLCTLPYGRNQETDGLLSLLPGFLARSESRSGKPLSSLSSSPRGVPVTRQLPPTHQDLPFNLPPCSPGERTGPPQPQTGSNHPGGCPLGGKPLEPILAWCPTDPGLAHDGDPPGLGLGAFGMLGLPIGPAERAGLAPVQDGEQIRSGPWGHTARVPIRAPCCVVSSKSLYLSEPPVTHPNSKMGATWGVFAWHRGILRDPWRRLREA